MNESTFQKSSDDTLVADENLPGDGDTTTGSGNPVAFIVISGATFYMVIGIMLLIGYGLWVTLLVSWLVGVSLGVLASVPAYARRRYRQIPSPLSAQVTFPGLRQH